ncbi:MAG TPA: TolC family protein, partial [Bdellovibrionales bacterium]|nr:TolC family protein [Bdellovibrionales bacterium]
MRNVALVIVFLLGVVPASGAEASAPAKSFDSALDEIVKRSTQVDIQKSRLTAADSLLLSSRLNFLPRLSLEATQTRAGEPASETKEIAGVATLNLFRFGSDWAAMRAAESNRDMEASRLASAALEAEQAGANALITLIETRLKLEVLKRRVQATESFLNIA